jgi:type IV secretion system protein VirD4
LAVSQLLTWEHSVIVNDIKGDLFTQTAGYRSKLGKVFVIDPRGVGHQYDPMLGKHTDLDLKSIAKSLLHKPDEGEGEVFTQRAARMLDAIFQAGRIENIPPLAYIAKLIDEPLPDVAQRINNVSPKLAVKFLDCSFERADFENKFLLSAWGTLTAKLDTLLADSIVQCFTGSDFTPKDLMCSDKPITVYLRWTESDLLVLSPLVKLLWSSFINELITTYDNRSGENCHPVLLLLDEAGRTAVPHLSDYASTVCGRGISLWIAVQDLSQLEEIYGRHKAKTFRNNCDTQIYYRPNDLDTARYLEERLGKKSEYAESKTSRQGIETTQGQSEQGVPLLTARNIMELKDEDIIGFYSNLKPFRAKRMDWRKYDVLVKRTKLPVPKISPLPPLAPLPAIASSKEDEEIAKQTENNIWSSEECFLNTLTNPDRVDSKVTNKNEKRAGDIYILLKNHKLTIWQTQKLKKQSLPTSSKRTKI